MASPIRERGLDGRIRIQIRDVNQLEAGSGLSIADVFCPVLDVAEADRRKEWNQPDNPHHQPENRQSPGMSLSVAARPREESKSGKEE
jgi:hypothetical protein